MTEIKKPSKYTITVSLLEGKQYEGVVDGINVANGLLILSLGTAINVFPLHNIKKYEFDEIKDDA